MAKLERMKRAASESVAARMLAGIFGVPTSDSLEEASKRADRSEAARLFPWSLTDVVLYSWKEDVRGVVFKGDMREELLKHLVAEEGTVHLVHDSDMQGKDALWLLVAEEGRCHDNSAGYVVHRVPARMIVNHVFLEETAYAVVAVQLSSCLRQS